MIVWWLIVVAFLVGALAGFFFAIVGFVYNQHRAEVIAVRADIEKAIRELHEQEERAHPKRSMIRPEATDRTSASIQPRPHGPIPPIKAYNPKLDRITEQRDPNRPAGGAWMT